MNAKRIATSLALYVFRATRAIKRSLQTALGRTRLFLQPVGRVFLWLLILPLYRFIVTKRLRFQRLSLTAKGFILFVITNRYLVHGVVGAVVLATVLGNIQSRQVHAQDAGQRTILFALATDRQNEIHEESVSHDKIVSNIRYLGTATIVSIPHIDFDYDEEVDSVLPSMAVPGTIAAQPIEPPSETPRTPRTRTESYVVQENDTISSIAQRFGVNVGTILWNNQLTERQYIRPGDALKIPPTSGILATIKSGDTLGKLADRYQSTVEEIASYNNLNPQDQLALGTELMIPGGRPTEIEQTRTQIIARGESSKISHGIAKTLIPPKVTAPIGIKKPADLDTKNIPSTRLLWPTSGRVITQYYGWRHTGLDIDGDYSSPIYASADGIVEKAGWNSGGYGLMILIQHPNGMRTRYAHASKMFVKAGETVKRGQVIAMVGTTGRSTGTHLHYEVYASGKRFNPLIYTK